MEPLSMEMLLFLLLTGCLAAFIDAVVGGGGMIALPALLLTGIPPGVVLATNKFAGTAGSLTSMISFFRSGKMDIRLVAYLFPLSFFGSMAGTLVVLQIPSQFLRPLVVFLLIAVLVYTLLKKNWGVRSTYNGMTVVKMVLTVGMAAVIGFYDGFFGPGTGSFLLFGFLMLGFDYVFAAGNTKVLNFGSNFGSLLTFMYMGAVNYAYGIPMAIGMVIGAVIGSQVAIRKGSAFVRPLFIAVTAVLIGKQLWDLL